jgi:predicted PurR-regulated permease PerM
MKSDGTIHIEVSTGTIIKSILLVLLVAALFFLRDMVLVILTAVVIASAAEPGIVKLRQWRISRLPAVMIIYLSVVTIFVATFYYLIPPLINDTSAFLSAFPQTVSDLDSKQIGGIDISKVNELLPVDELLKNFQGIASNVSGGIFKTTSALFGGLLSFVLIVVLSFYFAVQETGVDDFLRVITPLKHQNYVLSLWKRSQLKIGLWMQGQIVLALIVGVLTYLGLMVLGVPYALFLAILITIFELIPVFGPILGAIPAVIVAFATGGMSLGFLTVGLYIIIQQFENHLIYPLVVRKVVGVPPLLVIIGLIVGAEIAGFLGIILSVPIAAALKEYIDDVNKAKEQGRHISAA